MLFYIRHILIHFFFLFSLKLFIFNVILSSSRTIEVVSGQQLTKENANKLIDTTIGFLSKKYKDPMEPIAMKPRAIGINSKVGQIPVIIETEIKEGYITKVGKMKRIGNATMTVIPAPNDDEEDSTVIEARIGLEDIEFNTTVIFDVMGVKHEENTTGKVKKVSVFLILTTNGTTGERDVPFFEVTDIQGLDLQLKGPFEAIDRVRNIPVRIAIRIVMRTNFKRILLGIVSNAAQETVRGMAHRNDS